MFTKIVMISYQTFNVKMPPIRRRDVSAWVRRVAAGYGKRVGEVAYIFCDDEKILEVNRQYLNHDMPILILSHTYSPKGVLGNKFTINKTELSVQKRFWFSAFGYTDIILKGGKVWSKVSYPDLLLPNANLSYTIQPESYALMNANGFSWRSTRKP